LIEIGNFEDEDEDDDGQEGSVGHMFQYQIWKKSLDVQYLVEAGIIVVIAVIILVVSNLLVERENDIESLNSTLTTLRANNGSSADIASNTEKLSTYSDEYIHYYNCLLVVCSLTYSYLLKDTEEQMYCSMRKVRISPFTYKVSLNLLNFLVMTYWLIYFFADFNRGTSDMGSTERAQTLISRMEQADLFDIRYILSILIAFQFMRLIFTLQVSRTFGPMVKILLSMLMDISIFLFLYVFLFVIFASTGQLLFQELKQFSNIGQSSKTLFAASLGDFDYDLFDNLQDGTPTVGYVYLTIFLLFTAIMLLNFLIAILSNTYAELNDVQNALYLRKVIHLRQRYDYDRHFSAIVYSTPPFNILTIFFAPIVIYKKSRLLNRIFLISEYLWIGLISIIFFTISSILLMPFAYLAILALKGRTMPVRPFKSRCDIFLT